MALVFNHISLTPEQMQQGVLSPSVLGGGLGPESPRDGPEGFDSGSANAALKLLDDLCLMAGGNHLLCNMTHFFLSSMQELTCPIQPSLARKVVHTTSKVQNEAGTDQYRVLSRSLCIP